MGSVSSIELDEPLHMVVLLLFVFRLLTGEPFEDASLLSSNMIRFSWPFAMILSCFTSFNSSSYIAWEKDVISCQIMCEQSKSISWIYPVKFCSQTGPDIRGWVMLIFLVFLVITEPGRSVFSHPSNIGWDALYEVTLVPLLHYPLLHVSEKHYYTEEETEGDKPVYKLRALLNMSPTQPHHVSLPTKRSLGGIREIWEWKLDYIPLNIRTWNDYMTSIMRKIYSCLLIESVV